MAIDFFLGRLFWGIFMVGSLMDGLLVFGVRG